MQKRMAADYTDQNGETKTAIVWADPNGWGGEEVHMRVRYICERHGITPSDIRNVREWD